MKEVTVRRPLAMEPARALPRLERALLGLGYTVSVRSFDALTFLGGTTEGRHRLAVQADGQQARFVFAPGSPGVTLPAPEELERRVDAALHGLAAPGAVGAARRCPVCATQLGAQDTHCPTCGLQAG